MSATGMEGEMLLLAMLPHEDERLVIQTPRRRQVGELERFIADEYARVFPHRPALSRDVRLQKCMKTAEVQDRRQLSSAAKGSADGVFVDLGKNVQVGNVFQDMEPVYVVINKPKLGALPAPHADKKKHDKHAEGAKPPKTKAVDDKVGKDAAKDDAKTKRPRSAAAEIGKAHEADAAPTKKAKVKSPADKQETVNEKPAAPVESTTVKVKKSKEVTPSETTKPAKVKKVKESATDAAATSSTTPSTKVAIDKTTAKKTKKKASEETTDAKQPAAKRQKTEEEVAKEKESLISKKFGDVLKQQSTTTKSVTPAKIETSTHEKPKKVGRPAKTAGTEEVTTPVVVKKKVGRPSKADIEAAAAAAAAAAGVAVESPAPAPAVVKKKVGRPSNAEKEAAAAAAAALAADNSSTPAQPAIVKKKVGRPSKADKDAAAAAAAAAAVATPAAATDVVAAPAKKKVGRPSKADLEAAAAANAAAQTTTSAPEKPAKKLGRPSKADKEAAAAAAAASAAEAPKKLNESKKSPKATEKANGDGETEHSSNGSETKARRKVLLTFTERLAAARADVAQQHKMAQGEVEASEPKADHTDPKPSVKKSTPAVDAAKASPKVSPKVASKVSPKVSSVKPKVVASPPVQVPEPSSDSDSSATELEDSLPSKKQISQKARPAVVTKSPSSSDSDSSDEELDYSQSLLADLTKHGSDEEDSDVPSPEKPKAKKLNKVVLSQSDDVVTDSQDSVSSVDIPLAQSSQETNSLLMSSLAKNRFSLDRIPVAKLKKSSKNPFSQDSGIKVVKRHGPKSKSQ